MQVFFTFKSLQVDLFQYNLLKELNQLVNHSENWWIGNLISRAVKCAAIILIEWNHRNSPDCSFNIRSYVILFKTTTVYMQYCKTVHCNVHSREPHLNFITVHQLVPHRTVHGPRLVWAETMSNPVESYLFLYHFLFPGFGVQRRCECALFNSRPKEAEINLWFRLTVFYQCLTAVWTLWSVFMSFLLLVFSTFSRILNVT